MAATSTKVVNYTPEQTESAKADYLAGVSVETIAASLGKTARSVIAKLSKEGIYKAKEYVSKTGEKPVKKDAHADAIGAVLKLSDGEIDSLTKANKTALVKIFTALANSRPMDGEYFTEAELASLKRANATVRAKVFAALDAGGITE